MCSSDLSDVQLLRQHHDQKRKLLPLHELREYQRLQLSSTGVPLKLFCEKFAHTRFEPSGWSGNPEIGYAKSIMDYIFRWLQMRFLTGQQQMLFENLRLRPATLPPSAEGGEAGSTAPQQRPENRELRTGSGSVHAADALSSLIDLGDAPSCSFCGSIMTRNGSCYRCGSCGSTSGCS